MIMAHFSRHHFNARAAYAARQLQELRLSLTQNTTAEEQAVDEIAELVLLVQEAERAARKLDRLTRGSGPQSTADYTNADPMTRWGFELWAFRGYLSYMELHPSPWPLMTLAEFRLHLADYARRGRVTVDSFTEASTFRPTAEEVAAYVAAVKADAVV